VVDKPWTLTPDLPAVFCLLLLAVTNTALAYLLYYRILAAVGATRLSLVTYIIPLSGVFWGWLILGERLHWTAFAALGLILASVGTVSDMLPGKNDNGFSVDPFGQAARFIPEKSLHLGIRIFMAIVCSGFLLRRILEYSDYLVKPLWVVETLIYVLLILAFLIRVHPVDRARGLAEIAIPGVGALLPFALLLSPPVGFILRNRPLHLSIFWFMALSTLLTVCGMWYLRRSFSITVEARELVIGGPYRLLRHPIYCGEILAAAMVAVWRFSWVNAGVLVLFVFLQLIRARMEEEKLKRNFPEYVDYSKKTWWLWKN
jgi:protein-S-isoprenylcysteine O-methyltransferase Ste14